MAIYILDAAAYLAIKLKFPRSLQTSLRLMTPLRQDVPGLDTILSAGEKLRAACIPMCLTWENGSLATAAVWAAGSLQQSAPSVASLAPVSAPSAGTIATSADDWIDVAPPGELSKLYKKILFQYKIDIEQFLVFLSEDITNLLNW